MKHIYFWMLTVFCFTATFAQLTQDFESETLDGWNSFATGADDPGFVRTEAFVHSGDYSYIHTDANLTEESTSYLVSPAYVVESGDEFSVYVSQYFSITYYEYSGIYISTGSNDPIANPSDFTELYELGSGFAEGSWEQVVESLDSYVGQTVHFAFVYRGDYSHRFYVDDLYVGQTCIAPTATFTEVADCDNFEYSVDIEVSDFGNADAVSISDDQNNELSISNPGTYTFGPYDSNTTVAFEIADENNEFCKTLGTAYYVCAPSNDDCEGATDISSFPYTASFDATGATQDGFLSCNNVSFNDGVWYSFEGESALYTINLTSYGFDSAVGVFTGSCDALECVTAIDDASDNEQETIEFVGQAGVTYYVALGNRNGSTDFPEGEFDIEILEEEVPCGSPTSLTVSAVTDLSATINWNNNDENVNYDLVYGLTGFTPGTDASNSGIMESPYELMDLTPETTYDIYVRGNCEPGYSDWVGPVTFTTLEEGAILPGTDCIHPITVESLPYATTDDTSNYGDDYDNGQGENCGSTSQYYLSGDDVVYAYTATSDTSIDITMSPTDTWSGIFVYENCADIGVNCIAGVANTGSDDREIDNLDVVSGQTYYIIISTWTSPQSTEYDLEIKENTCLEATYSISSAGICENEEFFVNIEFTDMGSLSSYNITDNQGSDSQEITESGLYTFGPYASETEIEFNFETDDPNCSTTENFTYRCPSIGDTCDNPIIVENLPYSTQDSTSNYFDDYDGSPGENCGTTTNYLGGDDVVYAYTATSNTSIDIAMDPEGTYSSIFVYESCEDIGTNCVAGVSGNSTNVRLIEDFIVDEGQTYYILISTWPSPQTVDYTLDITENSCTPIQYTLTYNEDCELGEYSVTVDITSFGSSDTVTVEDDQSNSESLSEIGSVEFGPYGIDEQVTLTFTTDDETCNETETLAAACPAVNIDCETAIELTVGSTFDENAYIASNIGATDSGIDTPGCGSYNGADVWFMFTVPDSGIVKIETNADSGNDPISDSVMSIYTGACSDDLTEISCDDDSGNGLYSLIELSGPDVAAGDVVYVRVWEYGSNDEGSFLVSAYDDNSCTPITYTASVILDCDETQTYTIAFDITSLGTATAVDFVDDQGGEVVSVTETGVVEFGPYATGTEVTISADAGDENCNFEESFVAYCPPSNDECDTAISIVAETGVTEPTQYVEGNITGATDSGIEPQSCDGYTGNPNDDVWYSFEATAENMNITVDDNFDGVVELFEGVCGDLIHITCADITPEIEATGLTVGNTYYVRVFNYGSGTPSDPTFTIAVWSSTLGVNELADNSQAKIYPNPTSNYLNVKGLDIEQVQVYTMSGKSVQVAIDNNIVDVSKLPAGTYILRLVDIEGNVIHKKFIKK